MRRLKFLMQMVIFIAFTQVCSAQVGTLKVLVWNVAKGVNSQWSQDLEALIQDVDLVFLQEVWVKHWPSFFDSPVWYKVFAPQLNFLGYPSGVLVLSRYPIINSEVRKPPVRELYFTTRKMGLWSLIQLPEMCLTALNVHAINFVGLKAYKTFIQNLLPSQKSWLENDHLILAGDWNTWSKSRGVFLKNFWHAWGPLEWVLFSPDPRRLILDHIAIKGFKIREARVLSQISSSDHWPLWAELEPIFNESGALACP